MLHLNRFVLKTLILTISLFIFSCGQNDRKQKELDIKDKELALKQKELDLKEKEILLKERDTIKHASLNTSKSDFQKTKTTAPGTKIMKMTFKEYSEGDLMHLIFMEAGTGKEYDFGNDIDQKKYNGAKILLEDQTSAFGYKANPKYLNKSFTIEAVRKTVLTSDPITGKAVKEKAWVINDLKLIE